MKKFLNLICIAFVFSACSTDDKEEFDYSFLTGVEWKRSAFILPLSVDLNGDGNYSTNMLNEFECMADASFILFNDKRVVYKNENLVLITSSPSNSEELLCIDNEPGITLDGTFDMISDNKVKIDFPEHFPNIPPFSIEFRFNNNKMTRIYSQHYPTSYDTITNNYNREYIEIKEIFVK